jgi:predicted acetyltransferase
MKNLELVVPQSPEELSEFAPIVSWAFHDTLDGASQWLRRSRIEDLRFARTGGRLVGGLAMIPMGQWFGGRSVPLLGLAGVAVAASARGTGVAFSMVSRTLREARERGLALSALFPSTQALYRKLGYEVAGAYCRVELRLGECPRFRSELELEDAEPGDQAEIERLYATVARERPGYLDRGQYIWGRVREYGGAPARGVVVRSAAGIEGYAFLGHGQPSKEHQHSLRLTDFVSASAGATRRLLDFLACHRSVTQVASWFGGAADQRLLLLPDKIYKVAVEGYWMSRIIDVGRALELRGYPDALECELELTVEDELLTENTGGYRLSVSAGRGSVTRVARAAGARLDVRALSALYTGFLPPRELARAGVLEADERALSVLTSIFGGAAPALSDFF